MSKLLNSNPNQSKVPPARMPVSQFQAKVAELRALSAKATSDDELRRISSNIARISRQFRIQYGIGLPSSPLLQAQELNPDYRNRPHIEYLSDRILTAVEDVERGMDRNLVISMPPRSGKSTLVSYYTPLWLLRRHPEWKQITTSYDGSLTGGWARDIRTMIEDRPDLGIALKRDGGAGGRWTTLEGGGIWSDSTRGNLTGRGAKVFIIDDPIKDFVEAHSETQRETLWNWWLSVAQTRLEHPTLVLVVMCMTGDTPVLRPDGTETPLRDIRPGDEIATYEDGRITTSRVLNWANQGPDDVYSVTMESGRVVRANARHPFRTLDAEGNESWTRVQDLKPGHRVVSAEKCAPRTDAVDLSTAEAFAAATTSGTVGTVGVPLHPQTGANGRVSSARKTSVIERSAPRGYASRTTTRSGGQTDSADLLRNSNEPATGNTGTASPKSSSRIFSKSRMAGARSAAASRMLRTLVDVWSYLSITSTKRKSQEGSDHGSLAVASEDYSATTATSSSGTEPQSNDFILLSSTYERGVDVVQSVELTGREDVFDIEVERTHNFIANGIQVSNTRWHEDDFVGRLLSKDHAGNPVDWENIRLPALAEEYDVLDRAEGEPLLSPLVENETVEQAVARWEQLRDSVGSYTFASMFQQRPSPAKGAIFDTSWWHYWTTDKSKTVDDEGNDVPNVHLIDPDEIAAAQWVDSWDTSFKSSSDSDWVVGQRWAKFGANRYLISQKRGKWNFTKTLEEMVKWAVPDDPEMNPNGHLVHQRLIEGSANGPAIIQTLRSKISGLKEVNPRTSKEARGRAVSPEVESGNVLLPHPGDPGNEWVRELLDEIRNFPHGTNDDQVDALTQALNHLRDVGQAYLTIPGQVVLRQSPTEGYRGVSSRRDIPSRPGGRVLGISRR